MKFSTIIRQITASIFLCSFALSVFAHDAWVDPSSGPIFKIFYGHKIPETYKAEKVISIKAFDSKQRSLQVDKIETKDGMSVRVNNGKPAIFALEFDNGFWVKIGKESKNVRKTQMPEGTDPSHPLKYSKTIKIWESWMRKPLGQRIEFVPVDYNGPPKPGTRLKLQLLLEGKPLSNQMVENNSNEKGPKTDKNGFVTVTVLNGENRFATDHDIKQPDDPDAKRLSLTAALVFNSK